MVQQRQIDVGIVGGGPAGLAMGIAARRKGLRATVFEAARPPIDKACGEGLMPDAVAALRKLGVGLDPAASAAFRGIRFVEPGRSLEAAFPSGSGVGIRRTTLHQILIEHASAAGVGLHWGALVRGVSGEVISLEGQSFRCAWIVGADGQNSRVRRWAGLDAGRPAASRYGFRRHFRTGLWTDFVEVHWSGSAQAYVTPVGPEEICVAVLSHDPSVRFGDLFRLFPELGRRLENATPVTGVRGGVSLTRSLKKVCAGRVALVGDASGSVDAITGEGLCLAFQQAVALADALVNGDLATYQARHRRIGRLPAAMTGLMLRLDRHPSLRRRVFAALSADPAMFSRLLAIHLGALPPSSVGVRGALALGWRVATA